MDKIIAKNLNLWYGKFQALINVNVAFKERQITAIVGPSGCGKSTLLRAFNRMNDLIEGVRTSGEILVEGKNILNGSTDLVWLRKRVGMVFQRPNPFPLSIYENIAFGLKIHESMNRYAIEEMVEKSLKQVGLWQELKDKLKKSALDLSLEQRQRLCIARLVAVKPEILLMDEPCSALDPIATQKIEELIHELKTSYTIIIVTHNMQQAARVSDITAFLYLGKLIEVGVTDALFTRPNLKQTEDYITGRFG